MLEKDERETEKFRQALLERHKTSFGLNNRLLQLAENMTKKWKIRGDVRLHDVVAFLFGKAYKTFEAVDILTQRGFGQDAAILTRSLFEILVMSKWIIAEDSSRIDKFANYHHVLRKELFGMCKKDVVNGRFSRTPETEAILNNNDIMKKIESEYLCVKHLYPKKHYWSGKTIKVMAEEIGLDYEYDYLYWTLSNQVHSNSMVIPDYTNFSEGEMEFECGPSESFLPDALCLSSYFFFNILSVANQTFQLEFEDRISEIANLLRQHSIIE